MTDYSKMSDFEINKSVAEHESVRGFHCENIGDGSPLRFQNWKELDYCNNPADAWPIIVKHGIGIIPFKNGLSESWDLGKGLINGTVKDKNPLRAAMIVFLMMNEAENV